MRVSFVCLALLALGPASALAQTKATPKAGAAQAETRYFTALDGLMDGNADIVLKETRQGKTVTAATLDVCYPAEKGSDRKDRFVVNLTVSGNTLSGSSESVVDKRPVAVKLTRKATGDTFEFKGDITIGPITTGIASSDNADMSESEYRETQATEDTIAAAPKDFTEVSPEAVGVRLRIEAVADFVKSLRGQPVEVSFATLAVGCESLRFGEQTLILTVDPDRAAAFVAKAKTYPGVVSAGWTIGQVEMDRTIRFAAAEWRSGDAVNRDKIAAAVGRVLTTAMKARLVSTTWNDATGKLTLTMKRPSAVVPALGLTETIEVNALVAPDRPGPTDRLMLWIGSPAITTADESEGPKLAIVDASGSEEEADPKDDNNAVAALATEFKAQRWDSDKSAWK